MAEGRRKTILLVEDEVIIAMAEKSTLEKFGYRVTIACDGESAIAKACDDPEIDLVLMDINLGNGMDGTEAALKILELRDLPLIFLSSHTERDIVERTEGITSYGYIFKNSGETVLAASIRMAFRLFEAKQKEREKDEELRESETKFRNLYEHAPIGIFITDTGGRVISVNSAMALILGFRSVQETLDYYDNFSEQLYVALERRADFIRLLSEFGHIEDFEYEAWTRDRRRIWLSMNARLVRRDIDGSALIEGFTKDITARKRAEEELKESQALYSSLVEQMPAYLFRKDREGRYIFANSLYCRLKGLKLEDLLGRFPLETIDRLKLPEGRDLSEKLSRERTLAAQGKGHHERIMRTGESIETEETYILLDGSMRHFHVVKSPVFSSRGEVIGSQGILIDVTERKKVEEAYRVLSARNEAILDSVPDIIMEVDRSKVYTWANKAGYEFFGDDVIGKEAAHYFVGEQDTYERVEPILSGGSDIVYVESWQRRRDGEGRLLAWRCKPLKDAGGNVSGVLSSAHDITEYRRTQEASRLNEVRLESLLRTSQYPAKDIQDLLDFAMKEAVYLTSSNRGYFYSYDDARREFTLNSWSRENANGDLVTEPKTQYRLEEIGIWGEALLRGKPLVVNDFKAAVASRKGSSGDFPGLERFLLIPVAEGREIAAAVAVANKAEDYSESDVRQLKLMVDSVWKIVQKQRSEERIRTLLREKELVLKETHHRVKNNMGVIQSLLSMEAERLEEGRGKEVLIDASRRVAGMSMLYDRLYRSESYVSLNMKEFLPSLVEEIVGLFPSSPRVEVSVAAEDFSLSAKHLSPIGIILNEFISNSMKHAFKGMEGGRIELRASRRENTVRFEYSDNGAGLATSEAPGKSPGFGLVLIDLLVQQIEASLLVERGPGLRYTLEFRD